MDSQTLKPWLNHKGQTLADRQLKKVSSSWSQKTWDEYFSYSGIDKPLASYERTKKSYDDILNHQIQNIFDNLKSGALNLESKIRKLNNDERHLIKLLFWENLTINQAKDVLNLSYYLTAKLKTQSFKKLEKILLQDMEDQFICNN